MRTISQLMVVLGFIWISTACAMGYRLKAADVAGKHINAAYKQSSWTLKEHISDLYALEESITRSRPMIFLPAVIMFVGAFLLDAQRGR